jgi:YD repeat-containing protein
MSNYDNLSLVETALTFDGRTTQGSLTIQQNEFDLSTLEFLPDIPLEDQIEVERIFDTGLDSKLGSIVFTIADRRNMFILAKGWYTINPQTKIMTVSIPAATEDTNGQLYPYSRTYYTEGVAGIEDPQRVDIPNTLQYETTSYVVSGQTVIREPDVFIVRRKTLSNASVVTFAPGTRLTTTQLNLQFNQLKYVLQELLSKVRNEVILKYDENAIDGPFLGNTDLRMSGRYIKNLASPSLINLETTTGYPFVTGNITVKGKEFAVNHSALHEALFCGVMHRTGIISNNAAFSGHFTAAASDTIGGAVTNRKIINLANGTADTDAATFGQARNASTINTGTLTNSVLSNIPLSKLSITNDGYQLPVSALIDSGAVESVYGQSTASNTSNMVVITVDSKGRVTSIAERNMATEDLPNVATVTTGTYGRNSAGNDSNMVSFTVDSKGRITGATQRSLNNADLPTMAGLSSGSYGAASGTGSNTLTRFSVSDKGLITSVNHRNIEVNDLPTTGVSDAGTYGQTTATNTNNMVRFTYDAQGRITSALHRNMEHNDLPNSIPLSKLSTTNSGYTLPSSAIADGSILLQKLDFVTSGQGSIPLAFLPTNIPLSSINPATVGGFVLPASTLPSHGQAGTFGATIPALTITTDGKGRITTISERSLLASDIPNLDASKISTGTFGTSLIPTSVVTDNALRWDSSNSVYSAFFGGSNRRISNVLNPTDAQDVVTKNYLENNALFVNVNNIISATNKPIKDVAMAASPAANDATTVGYVTSLALYGQTPTIPATITKSFSTGIVDGALYRYEFTYTNGASDNLDSPTAEMLLVLDSDNKTYTPVTTPTAFGFSLDVGTTTKTVKVWLSASSMSGKSLFVRNFGISRITSTGAATTTSLGTVSVPTSGGILVNNGAISLNAATATQLGGIKIAAGSGFVVNPNGFANVDLTNSITSNNGTKVASALAVNTLRLASMLLDGSQQMTGKLQTRMPDSSSASVFIPTAGLDPQAVNLTDGDLWHNNGLLRFRSSGASKTIAFTDSNMSGNTATASTLLTPRNIAISGAVTATGVAFDGSQPITLVTTQNNDSVILGTHTTGNYVATASAGTGISVSGSGVENAGITITNTDTGSSQNIFKTVTAGGTGVMAASNNANLTLTAGTGITIAGDNSTKTITITNTATQPNTFGTVNVAGTDLIANSSAATLTVSQGTGITLTPSASTDTFTIANAGVVSLAGTTDQVTVSGSTGAVTLSLPQAINTTSTPTFGSVTANNIRLGSAANTIISTNTNGNIILTPNGTGLVNITKNLDVDGTLTVDGTTTLTGGITLTGNVGAAGNISMTGADPQLQIGATGSNQVVIDRKTAAVSGVAAIGDLEFRLASGTKAFIVPHLTNNPTADNEIITKASLTSTLTPYALTANVLTLAGGKNSGAAQALGTATAHDTTIATNNVTRVTVGSAGGLTVNSGGLTVTSGNLTLSSGKATSTATVSGDGTTTLTTKGYVDTAVSNVSSNGIIRAWIEFNGFNATKIAGSSNVSVVRNSTGTWTLTFNPALPTANYGVMITSTPYNNSNASVLTCVAGSNAGGAPSAATTPNVKTASSLVLIAANANTRYDVARVYVTIIS